MNSIRGSEPAGGSKPAASGHRNGAAHDPYRSNGAGSGGSHGNNSSSAGPYSFKPFNTTSYKPPAWQTQSRVTIPYTPEEYARILASLDKVLGPEYVSFRPGGGGQKVSYIEGWRALNLANDIFGFNGWLSELISSQVDYFDTQNGSGRVSMGLSVVVRITIRDGTYHEDFGYGYIENAKNKAMAFEKCKKEAFTDGLKRCLRCFGNVLGNCLYDRSILPKLQKVKLPPAELEPDDFYRDPLLLDREKRKQKQAQQARQAHEAHAQAHSGPQAQQPQSHTAQQAPKQAPRVPESAKLAAPRPSLASATTPRGTGTSSRDTDTMGPPDKPARRGSPINDIVDDFDDSFVFSDDIQPMDEDDKMSQNDGLDDYELEMLLLKNRASGGTDDLALTARSKYDGAASAVSIPEAAIPQNVSFVSAKAADMIQKNPTDDASRLPQFDPKFVASSIRRTVDPTKSTPIKRTSAVPSTASRGSAVSPASSTTSSSASSLSGAIPSTPAPALGFAPVAASTPGSSVLGKRLLGLPPSQKQPYKRLHRDLSQLSAQSQPSQGDRDSHTQTAQPEGAT